VAHHRAQAPFLTQTQEEMILIGGFGLFWLGKLRIHWSRESSKIDIFGASCSNCYTFLGPRWRHCAGDRDSRGRPHRSVASSRSAEAWEHAKGTTTVQRLGLCCRGMVLLRVVSGRLYSARTLRVRGADMTDESVHVAWEHCGIRVYWSGNAWIYRRRSHNVYR
jgi:hypothetical protein